MHAAQEWPVVDVAPGHEAVEVRPKGEFADARADLVLAYRHLGPAIEVAEMSVGIEAAQIRLAQLHQDLPGGYGVARVLQVIGLADRIGIDVLRVSARHDLLHLERLSWTAGDDGFGPLLN